MEEIARQLEGRRMALLGLGVENQALGRFFRARGLRFSACDAKPPEALEELRREWGDGVEEWRLGEGYLERLEDFDLVWRTPGIPCLRPELQKARSRGVEISSQTRLFLAACPAPVLGVTGTKGKGTTTSLIGAALEGGPHHKVWVGGNIGRPPISFAAELDPADLVLLELSSFQLQDLDRSPGIAVVLDIAVDHLDYHADQEEYVEAKRAISRHQGPGDILVVGQDCPRARSFAEQSRAQVWRFSAAGEVEVGAWVAQERVWLRRPGGSPEEVCRVGEIRLRGRHNQENVAAAAAAAAAVGAATGRIGAGIRTFKGLEHRLEWVGECGGVHFYNDSLATTPDATLAALQAFAEPLILIAGGSSKGADFAALGRGIAAAPVRAVVLLGQEGGRIGAAAIAAGFAGELVEGCRDMAEAVAASRARARIGDVVLLSPGCASFGMFANYKDRGEQFKRWARQA